VIVYLLGWLILVVVSLVLSLGALAWALRTGQFEDQGRARHLALEGGPVDALEPAPRRVPVEVYALGVVGVVVVLGLLAPVVFCLLRPAGG
jgi:cbb3-type cytochrome oxidase maturation protein